MPLNKDIENILDPILATLSAPLESTISGQLAEVYISGQAEMITWGKTKGGIPIAYEGPQFHKQLIGRRSTLLLWLREWMKRLRGDWLILSVKGLKISVVSQDYPVIYELPLEI